MIIYLLSPEAEHSRYLKCLPNSEQENLLSLLPYNSKKHYIYITSLSNKIMKKRLIILICIIFVLFFVGNGMAISSDLKSSYSPGETAIVKLSGSILEPIMPEQVEFKRNNVRVPFDYDIKRLGDDYYLWFILPLNESQKNYTLYIYDIATTVLGFTQEIDFVQNFSIAGNISDYTIKPGFVFTLSDFKVDATLNTDNPINIEIKFLENYGFTLKPGKNTLPFSIKDIKNTEFRLIKIGNYNLPAYIIRNQSSIMKKNNSIDVEPVKIDSIRLINEKDIIYSFRISNFGQNTIEDIYLEYDDDFFSVTPSKKMDIAPEDKINYSIKIKNTKKNISESIFIKSDKNNISFELPVNLLFVKNLSKINQSIITEHVKNGTTLSCYEIGGTVCSANEQCLGDIVSSIDGACCTDLCTESNGGGSSSAWVGYLIAILVAAGLVYLYIRYKKVKPDKNPIEKNIDEFKKIP